MENRPGSEKWMLGLADVGGGTMLIGMHMGHDNGMMEMLGAA